MCPAKSLSEDRAVLRERLDKLRRESGGMSMRALELHMGVAAGTLSKIFRSLKPTKLTAHLLASIEIALDRPGAARELTRGMKWSSLLSTFEFKRALRERTLLDEQNSAIAELSAIRDELSDLRRPQSVVNETTSRGGAMAAVRRLERRAFLLAKRLQGNLLARMLPASHTTAAAVDSNAGMARGRAHSTLNAIGEAIYDVLVAHADCIAAEGIETAETIVARLERAIQVRTLELMFARRQALGPDLGQKDDPFDQNLVVEE